MEELLITEPGPPKGAKPINGTASKSIAPPVGAKKKEDTVSEPDSNDGSTQAGSDVSQEPGPKGAQPSGKSTESKPGFFNNLKSAWDELVTDFNTPKTEEAPPDPLVNAVKRGLNLANQAEVISPFNTPTKKDFKDIARGQTEVASLQASPQYQKFSSAETFGDALKALKDNPVQIIAELTAESMSSLASYGASRMAAGAGMGAAAGSVLPGIGTAAGAGSGLIVGLADTSLALEYSSKFIEILKEQGVDVTDEKSLESAFSNEEIISKARESAYKKSIPIAIFDLISGGVAGKIVKKPATSLLGKVASGAAEFGVQAGLGGGGEVAGQIVAGEKIQPGAVLGEMIGELGTTPVEVMANTAGTIKQGLSTPPPAQVVSETRTEVKSTDDTQGAENAAEKILEATQTPNAIVEEPLTTTTDAKVNQESQITPEEITGEPSVTQPETKSPEGQVQEGEVISQGTEADVSTVGTNYQKVNGNWQVKQADGSWADIVTDTPNKTPEQQSTELTQMKDLLSQMEASEPQNLKMSPTEKGRIAKLEPQTERGAVRKFFWDGGKVLWRTQDPKSSIPRKGIAEEGGLSEGDKAPIKEYVDDKKGLSIDQVVESIMDQYTDMEGNKRFTDSDAVKTAVIEVLAQSDPKTWYAEQMETEDQEYLLGKPARDEEMSNLSGKIAHLEAEEQGINETNKQLYENERRVDRGGESQSGSQADGQVRGEQKEEEGGREPALLIQQNGNRDKSQQALKELRTLNLTHVPGLGMGQNQAKGTYISTEEQNRYETADKKAIPVTVAITNPYVADESYFDIQRAAIQKRFGKNAIEDLDTAELDLLSTMMTEYFSKENYDSIYFPKTETQEGELIVFDRSKVTIMDDARIEYENAVHASTQTTLQLEFVPDAEFLKTDKPIELRERQKKIRKDLARLNQLIKCR